VNAIGGKVASVLTGIATAIVIVTITILPFLTPQWVAFEQGRAQATAWTGYTTQELRTATDAILSDLILGGRFDVQVNGQTVLEPREQAHMSDVRTVFRGLWILAIISIGVLIVASRRPDRARMWRSVRNGARGLAVAVVALGVVGLVSFDQLFETFHEIFFPAGSFLFDPRTDKLVQLFPFDFWQETALVVGAVIIVVSIVVAFVAGRRAERTSQAAFVAGLAPIAGSESGS
jgi:integral membrane protein (TIGR01906 family)